MIQEGDKIKYVYLKVPNSIRENVIAFISDFPKETGLLNSIDYKLQFEKSFLQPVKVVTDAIGWKTEETATLDFLFG
jgi:DNA polymerase elongation subunit (family B)